MHSSFGRTRSYHKVRQEYRSKVDHCFRFRSNRWRWSKHQQNGSRALACIILRIFSGVRMPLFLVIYFWTLHYLNGTNKLTRWMKKFASTTKKKEEQGLQSLAMRSFSSQQVSWFLQQRIIARAVNYGNKKKAKVSTHGKVLFHCQILVSTWDATGTKSFTALPWEFIMMKQPKILIHGGCSPRWYMISMSIDVYLLGLPTKGCQWEYACTHVRAYPWTMNTGRLPNIFNIMWKPEALGNSLVHTVFSPVLLIILTADCWMLFISFSQGLNLKTFPVWS